LHKYDADVVLKAPDQFPMLPSLVDEYYILLSSSGQMVRCVSEELEHVHQATRRHNSENHNTNIYTYENLKSVIIRPIKFSYPFLSMIFTITNSDYRRV
jgi:hypothetical protein